jgi:CDP-paratose 2-epimerase
MRTSRRGQKPVVITGGAGFIGINLAHRLLSEGRPVVVFDNLLRKGTEQNLDWLTRRHDAGLEFVHGDVRDPDAVRRVVDQAEQVFHLAAQVAVTTSLDLPEEDFEINARGTLNVLEAVRSAPEPPGIIFTSTNKVYGAIEDFDLTPTGERYAPAGALRSIDESRPIAFHSPYGCSKGTADQYVLDYARSYGIRSVVFRMSCIYGPHQHGNEDQGWIAHFLIRALKQQPITIFGDGRQVRDVLIVEDLVDAFLLAWKKIDTLAGQPFNIGGGAGNTTSLLELLDRIESMTGRRLHVVHSPSRTGDQRYYVTDHGRFTAATGWQPRVGVEEGLQRLHDWLLEATKREPVPRRSARPSLRSVDVVAGEVGVR